MSCPYRAPFPPNNPDQQTYFSALVGSREVFDLLFDCIHYAQVRRLSRSSTIERICGNPKDGQQTRRAFWFLYSLEKTLCLHAEIIPVSAVLLGLSPAQINPDLGSRSGLCGLRTAHHRGRIRYQLAANPLSLCRPLRVCPQGVLQPGGVAEPKPRVDCAAREGAS